MRPATEADQAAAAQIPQMPRAFSVQGAREQQLGAASQAPLSMGQPAQMGQPAPRKEAGSDLKSDSRARLDYLIERADQIKFSMLQGGDIAGATAFRDFVQSEQESKLAKETWQTMKREGSSSPRLDFLMERADDFVLERVMAGDIEGAMVFRGYVQDRLSEHQRIILIPAKNDAYNTMFDYVCSNVRR